MRSWPSPDLPRVPGTGLPVRVHDTAAGTVRSIAPGPVARMYVCGITPYDATHLGHAATYVAFDLLNRAWRDAGHDVRYVQNVTDVDDPLLERAVERGEDWREVADRETALFRADMTALRVLPPTDYVGAVESIPLVVEVVERLRERGAVYELGGDLYFSVASDARFGALAGLSLPAMVDAFRERGGDPDRPGKKDPLDCLLWHRERPEEPSWEAALGRGRPGWHVECTAIALHHLGMGLDVQGGGTDLAFPHHEMCASQAHVAEAAWPFARAYVHTGMVGLDGEKMSKSRGNLVFVSRLREDGVDPMAVRLALLAHHYRADWEWDDADLRAAAGRLDRWRAATALPAGPPAAPVLDGVRRRVSDDLDAPAALRAVDRWVTEALARGGNDPAAPTAVAAITDALLGIALR
ncbi:MAG TPA: cysteine--1-D-myo-inosityl 2-amino-2-deoxy-alpha-D-glucopyranoside ligase [Jiangellales bacterium]|nr:cysteine--1-D-myo-inosityl 2-amino-2-deoxy-alpha-D-glucopyranoside ligase [Jiangellales bacterium]